MDPLAVAFAVFVLGMGGILVAGVVIVARRAGYPQPRWVRLAIGLTLALDAWLAATFILAWAGFYRSFSQLPPRVPLTVLTAIGIIVALSGTNGFREWLRACPPWFPVGLMSFRVVVELFLWELFREGRVPVQMTFEGRNFDILVGLSAPVMAWAVARGAVSSRVLTVWNLAGLALLANIVIIANTSAPGPLHLNWQGPPSTFLAEPPWIWLPAFLVPLAFFGHFASLQQIRYASVVRNAVVTSADGRP